VETKDAEGLAASPSRSNGQSKAESAAAEKAGSNFIVIIPLG